MICFTLQQQHTCLEFKVSFVFDRRPDKSNLIRIRNAMPVIQRIIPTRRREFWDSLDPNDNRQVLEAVKEEFDRPEPACELHYYCSSGPSQLPLAVYTVKVSLPCLRDCQIFLLRGAFHIEGRGRVIETGCSYLVKDEVWIGLCRGTTLVIMEEGEQRGVCLKKTKEMQERNLAERQSPKKLKKKSDPRCVPS